MPFARRTSFAIFAGLVSLTPRASAEEKVVSTAGELVSVIAGAYPGLVITLADGTYSMKGVTCGALGTPAAPITVRSATPLGAKLEFDALEGFHVTGSHWHFEGLDVRGVCASDDACEHAFHVTGGKAEGFVLRRSRVRDFNAQLKVNSDLDANGKFQMASHGLVEYSEFGDTHPRATANPVTKLNIDGGVGWVVRGNYLHDFRKAGGNEISYGAFMKSGGSDGLFERNLVACSKDDASGGVRIGLSFGGGGTAPQFCAPAFDANVPCSVEHTDGVMRNNLIVGCSDVGIYVNRGANTRVLFNTLVATSGVDFRFDTTTGESHANFLMGKVRSRDGASFVATDDVAEQPLEVFTALYAAPLSLDFALKGDPAPLQNAWPYPSVHVDYCARPRPQEKLAVGALEHSLGSCAVLPPPEADGAGGGGGSTGTSSGQGGADTTTGAGGTSSTSTGAPPLDHVTPEEDGGCSCNLPGASRSMPGSIAVLATTALGSTLVTRRRRRVRTG